MPMNVDFDHYICEDSSWQYAVFMDDLSGFSVDYRFTSSSRTTEVSKGAQGPILDPQKSMALRTCLQHLGDDSIASCRMRDNSKWTGSFASCLLLLCKQFPSSANLSRRNLHCLFKANLVNMLMAHLAYFVPMMKMTKLVASESAASDVFGAAVAIFGDYAIIGSKFDDVLGANDKGSAYIYFRSNTAWGQQVKLTASDGSAGAEFGYSVSIYGDYALIGARTADVSPNSYQGAAYVFLRSATTWSEQAKLIASDGATGDQFAISVSIDGDYALIGAWNDYASYSGQGSAYVFMRSGTIWNQHAKLVASDGAAGDSFGLAVSLSGNYGLIAAYRDDYLGIPDQGSVYIFFLSGTTWNQQAQLVASDGAANVRFGNSVSISGDYALVGSNLVNSNMGAAYVFFRSGTTWSQQVELIASDGANNDEFGYSVSIFGDFAIIGAWQWSGSQNDQGAAYIFLRSGTDWTQQAVLTAIDGASADLFGYAVSTSGEYALAGAVNHDIVFSDQGAAYLYYRNGVNWDFACPTGFKINGASCEPCGVGTYNDMIGQSGCVSCGAGTYNDQTGSTSSSACLDCVVGKYQALSGQSSCVDCGIGKYTDIPSQETCMDCFEGKYNSIIGQSSCTDCETGKYNEFVAQALCMNCDTGTYNPFTGSSSESDCTVCDAGKYNDVIGQSICTDCGTGKFNVNTGSTSIGACLNCAVGSFGGSVGLANCTPCVIDSFQNAVGQSFCDDCPLGTCTNDLTGQTSCDICSGFGFSIANVSGCDQSQSFSFATENCPTIGGVAISIFISNSSSLTDPLVTIDGNDCLDLLYSNSIVSCTLPAGVGVAEAVRVTDDATLSFVEVNLLSYALAAVTSVHGCNDYEALPHDNGTSSCSRDGIDEITVTGNNFGYPDYPAIVQVGGFKTVLIPLSSRSLSGWEQNTTIAQVPAGSGLGVGVNVLQKGGELSDGVRMLSYKSCDPGYYNLRNDSTGIYDCVECDSGYYNLASESFSCEICPSGSYCSSSSISSCDSILTDSFSPSGSADSGDCMCYPSFLKNDDACTCNVGHGYDGALDGCVECSIGKYKDSVSKTSCSDCPDIKETNDTGSIDLGDCVCPSSFLDDGGVCSCNVGFGFDGDSCVECSQDSIKPNISLSTCSSCKFDDSNSVSNDNSTVCICGIGFVMADQDCLKCVDGMICDEEGSVLTSISLESGHWRESSTDLSTRECPYEEACTGSSDISNQCLDGHSGPLCAVCEDGYTSANSNSACEKCFDGDHAAAFAIVLILLIIAALVLTMNKLFNAGMGDAANSVVDYLNTPVVRVRLKITLTYFQIIGSFTSVLSASLPSNYTTFLTISQTASLSFGSIFSPRCFNPSFNFYDELIARTLIPILVGIFILLLYIVPFIRSTAEAMPKLKFDFWSWIFLSCFIFFPSASTAVFEVFNCDDEFESGSSYLKVDYRLECDGAEYDGYRSYALLMILVYPIGIPLFFIICLVIRRNRIVADIDGNFLKEFDELNNSLKDYSQFSSINVADSSNLDVGESAVKELSNRLKIERARRLPDLMPYVPLFEAYKPEYWYWECVECIRRLSLTGLLVFMYPGSEKQILLAMLICMIFVIFYSWVQPYLDRSHNMILIGAQWGILIQLYGIYIIVNKSFDSRASDIGGGMVAVGVLVPVVSLFGAGCLSKLRVIGNIQGNGDRSIKQNELISRK